MEKDEQSVPEEDMPCARNFLCVSTSQCSSTLISSRADLSGYEAGISFVVDMTEIGLGLWPDEGSSGQ